MRANLGSDHHFMADLIALKLIKPKVGEQRHPCFYIYQFKLKMEATFYLQRLENTGQSRVREGAL